jgi:hypothetical protein
MNENAIDREVVDAAYRIHTTLGPGLLESFIKPSWRMNWPAGACGRRARKRFR